MKPRLQLPARQRGTATLVTVMTLFFILAMVAAYAGRNMVFEQRIASNYYRAGMAAEAAEAGAEWALSLLNGEKVDGLCKASTGGSDFRQRYLNIAADEGYGVPVNPGAQWLAGCTNTGDNQWACQCTNGGGLEDPQASARFQPMFGLRLAALTHSGQLRVTVRGCSAGLGQCSDQVVNAAESIGLAEQTVDLVLLSALRVPPASPLVAVGTIDLGSDTGVHNEVESAGGLVLQTGATLSGDTTRLSSVPGTPAGQALLTGDSSLQSATLFQSFFGMAASRYRGQPAITRLSCQGDCSAAIQAALARGRRLLWVDGDLTLGSNLSLGSADQPLLLVVDGQLTVNTPLDVNGLIYASGPVQWSNGSGMPSRLQGALMTAGSFTASGTVDLSYDAAILRKLNKQMGSFVRSPGGWYQMR